MLTWPAAEAVVLDMDGLLIDTEPVWRAAQSAVFAGFGIALSERDLLDSTGQPIEELIPVWRRRTRKASPLTDAEVAGLIVDHFLGEQTAAAMTASYDNGLAVRRGDRAQVLNARSNEKHLPA